MNSGPRMQTPTPPPYAPTQANARRDLSLIGAASSPASSQASVRTSPQGAPPALTRKRSLIGGSS